MDFERHNARFRRERAILVGVEFQAPDAVEARLDELQSLADSAGADVVGEVTQKRDRPDPAYFIGRGKAEEIKELGEELEVDLVLFDDDLSPTQVQKIEGVTGRRVVDRSELIMDIFATRARTAQSRLQVELAQLEYTLPRLRRMWTHLSRMKAGIGTRGPGEKQIETDRRIIQTRITELKNRLRKIRERRERQVEARGEVFTVSLVGYTNVGKSTLLNRLTAGGARVEDRLFMTLDTRSRGWELPGGLRAILSDTVGFIRKLPHHLISSFHATLEEARHADLLLHVIDPSHPEVHEQMASVDSVLVELGAGDRPQIRVLNKIDQLEDATALDEIVERFPDTIAVSAHSGQGMDALRQAVADRILESYREVDYLLEPAEGRLVAFLHERGVILEKGTDEQGRTQVRALLKPADHAAAERMKASPDDS